MEYEIKLKFLIDKMHTKKAKEVCKERIEYLKNVSMNCSMNVNLMGNDVELLINWITDFFNITEEELK